MKVVNLGEDKCMRASNRRQTQYRHLTDKVMSIRALEIRASRSWAGCLLARLATSDGMRRDRAGLEWREKCLEVISPEDDRASRVGSVYSRVSLGGEDGNHQAEE